MEEKMLPVPNEGHRRRQKQRRRRFPWGSIATVILVVAVCVYAFTLFGDKESPENSQVNDTTTQGPDDVQVGLSDESSPQNTQTANDDTDWNLVLVNYENAIPENYEPKLIEVPGGEKVDERMQNPILDCILIHCIQTYFCDHVSIFLRIEDFAARIRRHGPNRTAAAI